MRSFSPVGKSSRAVLTVLFGTPTWTSPGFVPLDINHSNSGIGMEPGPHPPGHGLKERALDGYNVQLRSPADM